MPLQVSCVVESKLLEEGLYKGFCIGFRVWGLGSKTFKWVLHKGFCIGDYYRAD